MKRIGIIICDRYKSCDGGKCFRAVREKEGAFRRYNDQELIIVGYSSCGGCPGGNIEYVATNMKKYGADFIHFATGFLAGYPPCPYITQFKDFIEKVIDVKVVIGTHSMPDNYIKAHNKIKDIPKKYQSWWEKLVDKVESTKYDSSRKSYYDDLSKELTSN